MSADTGPQPPELVVDTTSAVPPYEQLRHQLADLVSAGVLRPGERLPPLRQLAADLGLAVGTVARTYRELEAAGLVRSRRGGGTRVADAPPTLAPGDRSARLDALAAELVHGARLVGASADEVRAAVEKALRL
jgi:DNA-binding transcriptional regulator YhcF (GntR family)